MFPKHRLIFTNIQNTGCHLIFKKRPKDVEKQKQKQNLLQDHYEAVTEPIFFWPQIDLEGRRHVPLEVLKIIQEVFDHIFSTYLFLLSFCVTPSFAFCYSFFFYLIIFCLLFCLSSLRMDSVERIGPEVTKAPELCYRIFLFYPALYSWGDGIIRRH